MNLSLYTDGSCIGNPGPGGWAYVIIGDGQVLAKAAEGQRDTTNNRMEMKAIIEGLKKSTTGKGVTAITVFSDSNLIISTMSKNWKRKKNLDLWAEMDDVMMALHRAKLQVTWNWVKAHNGNHYNEMVDQMANSEARSV